MRDRFRDSWWKLVEQEEMEGNAQSLQSVLMDLNFCYFLLFTTVITAL